MISKILQESDKKYFMKNQKVKMVLQRLQQTRSPMVHHTRLRGSEGDNREVGETPSDLPNPLGRRRYRQPAKRFEG